MALHSTFMEEIHKYRREWLWRLLEEQFHGKQAALAKAANVSPGSLHDILNLNNNRNVGERIARRVEDNLGLAPGSLDKPIGPQKRSPRDRRQSQASKPKRLERATV